MPAEWEPHLATYLVWPHNLDTWPGNFAPIPGVFAQMAAAIASFEPVRILVKQPDQTDAIHAMIKAAARDEGVMARIELFHLPTNDSWIRDHGPIFVNRIDGQGQIALD